MRHLHPYIPMIVAIIWGVFTIALLADMLPLVVTLMEHAQ